jgi:hypothetical protein
MASLPSIPTPPLPSSRATRENTRALVLAGLALLLVIGAAILSHLWNSNSGLDVVYVMLALVIVALAFPFTREWLANATNVKLPGGLEISRQLEDATETVKGLPIVDESTEYAGEERLKVVSVEWQENPSAALKDLRKELRAKVTWIFDEIHPNKPRPATDVGAICKLDDEHLLSPQQARVAKAVLRASGRMVERSYDDDETRDDVVTFMEGADRVVHQLQLIALDRAVRHQLRKAGFKFLDFRGQPLRRWPDFYVIHPDHLEAPPLRIACRVAKAPGSKLIGETRARLRKKWTETPLDERAQRVIVIPNTSQSRWEADGDIPAMKRDEFLAWTAVYLAGDSESEPVPA